MLAVEIRVRGQINADWSKRFSDLAIVHASDGDTVLSGPVRDQSELRGILSSLADLGLELVSVTTEPASAPLDEDVMTGQEEQSSRRWGTKPGRKDDMV